jgi:hypothetical protein
MIDRVTRLSVNTSVAGRVIGVVFGLVFAGFGVVFAAVVWAVARGISSCLDITGIPSGLLPADCTDMSTYFGYSSPIQLFALVGVFFAVLGLLMVVASVRHGAWLDGTTLITRGLRRRRADLSTAEITAGVETSSSSDSNGHSRVRRTRVLTARAGGRSARLILDRLPPRELRLLAAAISEGRAGTDVDALRVAGQLREMADNPLELRFQP